jgi:quercetin dioxygenase-like cupin family protein
MAGLAICCQILLIAGMSIPATRFLGAGTVTPDPHWEMKAHVHDFHELIVIVGGRMTLSSGGRSSDCSPGDVLLYPRGVAHAERSHPEAPLASIFFSFTSTA